ncbi:sensor histidine kinase [Skermanella pratensis]|uniref:sensor histidine kinase n=1 Tax=Skermanella pratensis TaxID=2233999 RepID=UPI00130127C4|nr:ATP-binding protein [Skermanella pratensis]
MPDLGLLRTTTFRVALLYLGLFLASVLVILGLIYWFTAGFIERQTDETIAAEIAGLREHYRQRRLPGLIEVVNARSATPRTSTLYLVASPTYAPLAGNLSAWPDAAPDPDGWVEFEIKDAPPTPDGRRHDARAVMFTLSGGYHLLVGRDTRERGQFQERVLISLAWALLLTIGLGAAGGVLISRNVMHRIDAINRTTRQIMSGALQERMAVKGSGDELDQLAGNLNAMLDQIEQLMVGMRQVSDSIAHDLRTPLTRLRSRLEITLVECSGEDEYRGAIQEAIGEADRLLGIFSALLSIAEAEAGTLQRSFHKVALADIARRIADLYEPAAEEAGLSLDSDIQAEPVVLGNQQLLAQAVANLLDNALKYSPTGGRVTLTVDGPDGSRGAFISVADGGPGIPADQRESVLRRFVRLESSRSSPGNGLGLSLVDAVARLHGARLEMDDNRPGLIVAIVFPRIGAG